MRNYLEMVIAPLKLSTELSKIYIQFLKIGKPIEINKNGTIVKEQQRYYLLNKQLMNL